MMPPIAYFFRDARGARRFGLWALRRRWYLPFEPRGRYVCDLNVPGPLDPHALAIRRNRRRCPNRCASAFSKRANMMRRTLLLLSVRP